VPKTTRSAAIAGSGFISKYAVTSFATSMSEDNGAGLPASGLIWVVTRLAQPPGIGTRPRALDVAYPPVAAHIAIPTGSL